MTNEPTYRSIIFQAKGGRLGVVNLDQPAQSADLNLLLLVSSLPYPLACCRRCCRVRKALSTVTAVGVVAVPAVTHAATAALSVHCSIASTEMACT